MLIIYLDLNFVNGDDPWLTGWMTVKKWLESATARLATAEIGTARLDALVLLEDVLGKDRAWILAHDEEFLPAPQLAKLKKLLSQRAGHIPLAYVRGHTEFYGRDFVISPAVLEPRPESETMIELLKDLLTSNRIDIPKGEKVRIADVGTGSGALGITAFLELKNTRIELLELDEAALKIAKTNVDLFTLDIPARKSDLLSESRQESHILLCNLPYVPDSHHINRAASHEPSLAIFGGPDGLDIYRKLFQQIEKLPNRPLYILTESLPSQHSKLRGIAKNASYKLLKTDDFIQLFSIQK